MNVFIGYNTACDWWRHASQFDCDCLLKTNAVPSAKTARGHLDTAKALKDSSLLYSEPIHLCLPLEARSKQDQQYIFHRNTSYAPQAFLRYDSNVFIASPETTFLQMASQLSFEHLILLGTELTALYVRDELSDTGLSNREPVTKYANLCNISGKAKYLAHANFARKAAKYVVPNTASPMEGFTAVTLSLPLMYGGYGLPKPQCNYRIDIPKQLKHLSKKSFFKVDLCWPERHVAVEYDSNLVHTGAERIAADTERRNLLQHMGYTVIGITRAQVQDSALMDATAEELARALRIRKRVRTENYLVKKSELRRKLLDWTLGEK